jgi:hypothetical protein
MKCIVLILLLCSYIHLCSSINHRQYPNDNCKGTVFTETIVPSGECLVPEGRNDVSSIYNCKINNQSKLVMSAKTWPRSSECTQSTPKETERLAEVCVKLLGASISTYIDCSNGISYTLSTMIPLIVSLLFLVVVQ